VYPRPPSGAAPRVALPPAAALAELLAAALAARTRRALNRPGRRAAVLLPIYDIDGHPHLMLTKRTDTLPTHRGQISLPGGRWEELDGSLTATALREAQEEVGIPPGRVRVLGALDDVSTVVSDFIVTPVVGVLAEPPVPVPNPGEIARVFTAPVGEILAIDAELPEDAGVSELRYPLGGEDVWGATARILRGFAEVARDALRAA